MCGRKESVDICSCVGRLRYIIGHRTVENDEMGLFPYSGFWYSLQLALPFHCLTLSSVLLPYALLSMVPCFILYLIVCMAQ